jgi:hypothetical protein
MRNQTYERLGWRGTLIKGPDAPGGDYTRGKIAAQQPTPGAKGENR